MATPTFTLRTPVMISIVEEKPKTRGEMLVRVAFNPSDNSAVTRVKSLGAELINVVNELGRDERCTRIAEERLEEALMWAVKSVTATPSN